MIVEKTNEELQNDAQKSTPSSVVLMQTIIVRSNQAIRFAALSATNLVSPRSGYSVNRHADRTMLTLENYRLVGRTNSDYELSFSSVGDSLLTEQDER